MSKSDIKDFEQENRMLQEQNKAYQESCQKAFARIREMENHIQEMQIKFNNVLEFVNTNAVQHAKTLKLLIEGAL